MKTLKEFRELIQEMKDKVAWQMPDDASIDNEYKYEYSNHHSQYGFRDKEHFRQAVKNAEILDVTPEVDAKIAYRSHTSSFDDLHDLIKGYKSYPEFRNEKSLRALSDRIKNGDPVHYPMVLEYPGKKYKIMGGNTRADLAMQHHGHYKALILKK